MSQGPIGRIVCEHVEGRGDTRLSTAWIGGATGAHVGSDGQWLLRNPPRSARSSDAPILVFLGSDGEPPPAELLARPGARLYALVGPAWGKEQTDYRLFETSTVLVRRVDEVPAAAVCAGNEAWLWVGGGFVLRLDPTQAEALRQTFLRMFWHDATEEMWFYGLHAHSNAPSMFSQAAAGGTGSMGQPSRSAFLSSARAAGVVGSGGQPSKWRPAAERPFDVPLAPAAAVVRWDSPDARLTAKSPGSLAHVSNGPPPDTKLRRLWYPAGPEHHDRLARLVQMGVDVVWSDRGLPDILVDGNAGEILLPGKLGRLRVRLTLAQIVEVGGVLEAQPAWAFRTQVSLGDVSHRRAQFWLPGEKSARGMETEQVIEVGEIQAKSLHDAPVAKPTSFPPAQPLALAARYRWTVIPPRVPAGAQEDPLVVRWRKLDEDWKTRLDRVREALTASEQDRGRIGGAFARLKSAMLGFDRAHKDLIRRITECEGQRPSRVGPSEAHALMAKLAEIEDAARKLRADLDETERKAREDVERDKQKADWAQRVETAKDELPERRKDLVEAEERRAAVEAELTTIEENQKSVDGKRAKKDLAARRHRASDDLKRAINETRRLQEEIRSLEKLATDPFEFRPKVAPAARPAPSGGRFVPAPSSARPSVEVPDEALPEVGDLYNHKAQRYLAIQTWAELEAGEKAARRLSAQLVALEKT